MIIQGVTLNNISVYDNTFNTKSALLYIDIGKSSSYSGSGTTYTDLSGNANTGTSAGSPIYSNQYGGYSSFNGAGNQYIATATAKYNKTYTGKTVFIVARLTAITAGTFRCLFGTASGTRNFNTYIYSPSAGVYQIHYSAGGGGGFSNNLPLTLGQWFSVAVTHSTDGTVTYYFNGQPAGTNTGITFTQWASNGNENIGVGDNYWYGDIAVCAAYGRALNANEIQQDHNALAVRGYFDILTTNLVIWLDANNDASYSGTGIGLKDLSGNSYAHTLSNSNIYTILNDVRCFNCSSTGQVITANSVDIQIPATFTYISWVRTRSSTTGFRTLLRGYQANGSRPNGGHAIIVNNGTNILGMWDNATLTGFNSSGYNMTAYGDVWAQFVTVGDATGQTFYINGQQVGSSVTKSVAGQYHYAWGNIQGSADQPWGYVANMFLYSTKLSPTQIQQNYSALRNRYGI
jgi:Concanavalin A-like lectin/glucanases superfamily